MLYRFKYFSCASCTTGRSDAFFLILTQDKSSSMKDGEHVDQQVTKYYGQCNTPSSWEQVLHIVSIALFLIYWQHASLKVSRFCPHSSIKLTENAILYWKVHHIVHPLYSGDTCKMLLLSLVLRHQSKRGLDVED